MLVDGNGELVSAMSGEEHWIPLRRVMTRPHLMDTLSEELRLRVEVYKQAIDQREEALIHSPGAVRYVHERLKLNRAWYADVCALVDFTPDDDRWPGFLGTALWNYLATCNDCWQFNKVARNMFTRESFHEYTLIRTETIEQPGG